MLDRLLHHANVVITEANGYGPDVVSAGKSNGYHAYGEPRREPRL